MNEIDKPIEFPYEDYSILGDTAEIDKILNTRGPINLDAADVRSTLSKAAPNYIVTGSGDGGASIVNAFNEAMSKLPVRTENIGKILLNLWIAPDYKMTSVALLSDCITALNNSIDVCWGIAIDDSLTGQHTKITLLVSAKEPVFNNSDFKKWRSSCKEYITQIELRIHYAIKDNRISFDKMLNKSRAYRSVFCNPGDVNDLVSALQSYKWNIDRRVNDMIEYYIDRARSSSNDLFLEGLFSEWCHGEEHMTDKAVKSYISNIKRVNHDVLCNIGDDIFHSYLPDYVKTRNMSKIKEMFNAIDLKLNGLIDGAKETEIPRLNILNGRAAIRKYHQFIESLISPC